MEKWKKWLIVSGVCSIIVGIIGIIIFLSALIYCEPVYYILGEEMGGCSIVSSVLEEWWVIPLAFLMGFAAPALAFIIVVIYKSITEYY